MLRQRAGRQMACALAVALAAVGARATPVDIAIISDGDSQRDRETRAALIAELTGLEDFELTFRFPAQRQTAHGWRVESARQAIEAALADDAVDIVIALDILSSSVAASFAPDKPLIATTVIDPALQGFAVSESGTSGAANLHFLTVNFDLAAALREFQYATDAQHIGLLIDGSILRAVPVSEVVQRARGELDFDLSLVESPSADLESWLEAVPNGVDALFLTPLPRLDRESYERLVRFAQDQRWPTFTTLGREDVEAGALMGRGLVPRPEQLARRLAIDIRDIALGRSASELPVAMEVRDRLAINRLTAEAIGFQPSFELIFSADTINEELPAGRVLTLRAAVTEALERNLRLAVAQRDLEIAVEDTRVARSALLPQVGGDISWNSQDRDLVGINPTRTTEVGLSLSQSLYSESLRSSYRATALAQNAQAADLDATELDVIETAALTYLNVLIAKTQRDIQLENLNRTRANLERAESRYDVGATDRSEVFRFETELGTDQQNVASALAAYERQRFELNRVLKQPIGLAFQTAEPGIEATSLFGDPRLVRYLRGPRGVATLSAFLAEEALRNAPELAAIRAQIEAQQRLQLAAKRRRYVPTLDAFSRASRIVDDSGARFETDFDEDWSVGIEATWSLFQGGGIKAEQLRAALEVQQLELTLQQAADVIETDARGSLAEAASSRLNIGFAQSSAAAARKTLDLVTDAYVRGTASYIDLIDAQNTYLNARLAAANAVYQHLQDLVELQRSIAFFDFAVSAAENEAWLDRLDRFTPSTEEAPR